MDVRGIRDRALLLAWSGGGRRRSEVVGLQVGEVRRLDADTWLYALRDNKPIPAARAVKSRCAAPQLKRWRPG